MPLASIDPAIADGIPGRQACRILGCASHALQRAALLGHVRVLVLPGVPIRYSRADVERLAAGLRPNPRKVGA